MQAGGSPTPPNPDLLLPFYVEDISGSANTLYIKANSSYAPSFDVEYSTNLINWYQLGTTPSTAGLSLSIPANSRIYLRAITNAFCSQYDYNRIYCASAFNVGGNIMSLLWGSAFTGSETQYPNGNATTYVFSSLFNGDTTLASCEHLMLTGDNLPAGVYNNMFRSSGVTTGPTFTSSALPVYACTNMFRQCSRLVYLQCLFTSISSGALSNWMYSVTTTGILQKPSSATFWNANLIPANWTLVDI